MIEYAIDIVLKSGKQGQAICSGDFVASERKVYDWSMFVQLLDDNGLDGEILTESKLKSEWDEIEAMAIDVGWQILEDSKQFGGQYGNEYC